ncbi:hypothetical protein BH18ACI5_BH18ACI5_09410 [soil metagenome]
MRSRLHGCLRVEPGVQNLCLAPTSRDDEDARRQALPEDVATRPLTLGHAIS